MINVEKGKTKLSGAPIEILAELSAAIYGIHDSFVESGLSKKSATHLISASIAQAMIMIDENKEKEDK